MHQLLAEKKQFYSDNYAKLITRTGTHGPLCDFKLFNNIKIMQEFTILAYPMASF